MSFYVEFHAASPEEAALVLEQDHLPEEVKTVVVSALKSLTKPVFVKVQGHLYTGEPGNLDHSTVNIEVRPITFRS